MRKNNNFRTDAEFEDFLANIGGLVRVYRQDKGPIIKRNQFNVGNGWLGILERLFETLIRLGWDKSFINVKEKFGGLRFYINEGSDEIYNTISKYEELSYKTCEYCGDEGITINKKGWLITCCDKHSI